MGRSRKRRARICQLNRRQKPPVVVVSRAGALARNHRRAQWMPGCALLAKGRALRRLDHAAQDITGMTKRRLLRMNSGDLEAMLGIEFAVIRVQPPAALWNHANPPPCAVGN